MSEKVYFAIFVAFVLVGVLAHWRRQHRDVRSAAAVVAFFLVVSTISLAWICALKISDVVFGIFDIGWKSYFSKTVYIVEEQRHQVFLSDGRILQDGQLNLYHDTFAIALFIGVPLIGILLFKGLSRVFPSTCREVLKLAQDKKSQPRG
ncbi:MAG TPA: hypothetical protein VGI81_27075 [Tepidisphaeraceae bacterium]|jgi:hypothetical protein